MQLDRVNAMSASYGNGIRDHVDCGISTVQLNCMLRESPYGLPTLCYEHNNSYSSKGTRTAVSSQTFTKSSTFGPLPVCRPPIPLPTVSLIRLRPKMSRNSILPISSASSSTGAMGSSSAYPGLRDDEFESLGRSGRSLGVRLRRLTKFKTMDFELAFWQLTYLLVAPRRVYKQTYHHKQTKNVWARDDPAMVVLITGLITLAGLAWSLMYGLSATNSIYLILRMIFRDFLLSSLVTAGILWFLSNRLLIAPSAYSSPVDNRVEFAYAFDVAVNSFFPMFLTLYVALLPLSLVVVKSNWVCLFFGNTLFLIAGVQYWYVMYLGYAALPFVVRSELLLAPLLPIFVGYLLSLLGANISRIALDLYFMSMR